MSQATFHVTADSLNVRANSNVHSPVVGTLKKGDHVTPVRFSSDGHWARIEGERATGWCSTLFLSPDPAGGLDDICRLAANSAVANLTWLNRGRAPLGYVMGMALVYGRVYCKLQDGDPNAVEMAKACTGKPERDALALYASTFREFGMSNEAPGTDTLRHLFTLMFGLGMRESSGRFCEGRDQSASNTKADTAEAGMFQTSYDLHKVSPLLDPLFDSYLVKPDSGFRDEFCEGVKPTARDLKNFGDPSSRGFSFQKLSKDCPAFAAEFAAIGLRNGRKHWGPINTHAAEVRVEVDSLYLKVQNLVHDLGLKNLLLA